MSGSALSQSAVTSTKTAASPSFLNSITGKAEGVLDMRYRLEDDFNQSSLENIYAVSGTGKVTDALSLTLELSATRAAALKEYEVDNPTLKVSYTPISAAGGIYTMNLYSIMTPKFDKKSGSFDNRWSHLLDKEIPTSAGKTTVGGGYYVNYKYDAAIDDAADQTVDQKTWLSSSISPAGLKDLNIALYAEIFRTRQVEEDGNDVFTTTPRNALSLSYQATKALALSTTVMHYPSAGKYIETQQVRSYSDIIYSF